jgi:hypothetical protein
MHASLVDVAGASPTRHGLEDLYLFAVLFNKMADVYDALNAGVGMRDMLKMLTQTLRMTWLHPRKRWC